VTIQDIMKKADNLKIECMQAWNNIELDNSSGNSNINREDPTLISMQKQSNAIKKIIGGIENLVKNNTPSTLILSESIFDESLLNTICDEIFSPSDSKGETKSPKPTK